MPNLKCRWLHYLLAGRHYTTLWYIATKICPRQELNEQKFTPGFAEYPACTSDVAGYVFVTFSMKKWTKTRTKTGKINKYQTS